MEKELNPNLEEGKVTGKHTSYWKVMLIFSLAMAALLAGVNYLFSHIL